MPPAEHRRVSSTWYEFTSILYLDSADHPCVRFSLFQVVSSYTNTGMSLQDQSMVPFQTAYPMIIIMALLILAGNTAFVSLQHFPYHVCS